MEQYLPILIPAFFILSVGFSVLTNWLLLKFSHNLGVRNLKKQEEIRWSVTRKPALGGISFFIAFLLAFSLTGIMHPSSDAPFNLKLLGIAGSCSLGFLIGLADDAYNTNPLAKIIGQLTCAFILIATQFVIHITGIAAIDYMITTVWVIGMMNSINMLDNMDGISTSIAGSIILGILSIMLVSGHIEMDIMFLMVGVFGGLIGFLFFNWNPSKMYMGDTGSMFLGVFLSAISIHGIWGERLPDGSAVQVRQFIVPMLIFIIPLVDTTTVTIRRLMRKQSPFVGGRDHITHHLAYNGFKDRSVALLLLGLSLFSIPVVLLYYTKVITLNAPFCAAAVIYAVLLFTAMQIMYNKGAKLKALKDELDPKERKQKKPVTKLRKIS
jgi:UDP-GlcNAc:undecaprenyl-phosphate/decaprenyl-phosphate GlcNAc-1-phosphate transferase